MMVKFGDGSGEWRMTNDELRGGNVELRITNYGGAMSNVE